MMKRRSFIALGGASGLGIAGYLAMSGRAVRAQSATQLTPPQAHAAAARGDILLVDIRRPDEWAQTGVGEFAVPLDLREDDFITRVRAAQQGTAQPVALICARGVRSARTTVRLVEAGLTPSSMCPKAC